MDAIKTLVQNLILIVVMTVFLEMLLPSGIMRRYVKVVMGLVVIVSVLQTASGLLHKNMDFNIPVIVNMSGQEKADEIITVGQNMAEQNRNEALLKYKDGLERQVLAIARLNGELDILSAQVRVQGDLKSNDYGCIQEIVLIVKEHVGNLSKSVDSNPFQIEPIDIQVKEEQEALNSDTGRLSQELVQVQKIKDTLASFYNLTPEQVKVIVQEEK